MAGWKDLDKCSLETVIDTKGSLEMTLHGGREECFLEMVMSVLEGGSKENISDSNDILINL